MNKYPKTIDMAITPQKLQLDLLINQNQRLMLRQNHITLVRQVLTLRDFQLR